MRRRTCWFFLDSAPIVSYRAKLKSLTPACNLKIRCRLGNSFTALVPIE